MMIHKITPTLYFNWWRKCLDTQLSEPTEQNSLKIPKVVNPTIRKRCYKTLGTIVLNSLLSLKALLMNVAILVINIILTLTSDQLKISFIFHFISFTYRQTYVAIKRCPSFIF